MISPLRHATWQPIRTVRTSFGDSLPVEQVESFERETPARAQNFDSDVAVPFFQAVITGILSWPVFVMLVAWAGADTLYAIGFASAVAFVAWRIAVLDNRQLLRVVERVTGHDLDGDGYVGEPEESSAETPQPRQPVAVFVQQEDRKGYKVRHLDLPAPIEDKIRAIAFAVLNEGATFSRPELATRRKILTQAQYDELKKIMLHAGFARELRGNRTQITGAGRSFFRHYLTEETL